MINKLFKAIVGASAIVGLIGLPSVAMATPSHDGTSDPNKVTIDMYNLTDVHGHIEQVVKKNTVKEAGLAAVGCYLDKQRKTTGKNTTFTLLGDNIGASPFTSGALYDNPTIHALNLLDPLASTIGNHELDLGQDVFRARVKGEKANINGKEVPMTKVKFPYMAANIGGSLHDVLKPYKIETVAGVKIAFIGAIAEDMPYKLAPNTTKGMTFSDPIATVNKLAKQLKQNGKADIVIAMLDDDVKKNLNSFSNNVDGLMGGDTHVPYYFTKGESVDGLSEPAKISGTASGSYTDNLADLQIVYNKNTRKVESSRAIQIPASELAQCKVSSDSVAQDIANVVTQAEQESKAAGETVVAKGYAKPFYRGVYAETENGKPIPGSNRGIESTLGDLVADSIKETVMTQGPAPKPVDIGIINAGGLRNDLVPKDGNLTYAQTYGVMPFSNELGYITLSGQEFKQTLEEQWKRGLSTQNSRPMLKLGISSNVHYTYDWTKPSGSRITSITIDGKPMDMKKNYTVGSVTFLLAGGDSFTTIEKVNKTAGRAYKTSGNLDRDQFNKYLGARHGIAPEETKRSIGLSFDASKAYKPGETVALKLRGLSFSERGAFADGVPFSTKATAIIGGVPFEAAVDNKLYDPNGSWSQSRNGTSKAFATTDGVGQATVSVAVDKICQKNNGKKALPIEVKTDKGYPLTSAAGVTMTVDCPAKAVNASKHSAKLAKTGSDGANLALYGLLLLSAGALLIGIRYARIAK